MEFDNIIGESYFLRNLYSANRLTIAKRTQGCLAICSVEMARGDNMNLINDFYCSLHSELPANKEKA